MSNLQLKGILITASQCSITNGGNSFYAQKNQDGSNRAKIYVLVEGVNASIEHQGDLGL